MSLVRVVSIQFICPTSLLVEFMGFCLDSSTGISALCNSQRPTNLKTQFKVEAVG